jgi:hypothetical protein
MKTKVCDILFSFTVMVLHGDKACRYLSLGQIVKEDEMDVVCSMQERDKCIEKCG